MVIYDYDCVWLRKRTVKSSEGRKEDENIVIYDCVWLRKRAVKSSENRQDDDNVDADNYLCFGSGKHKGNGNRGPREGGGNF